MWHSPQDVVNTRTTTAIHSCSSMLYVMAERWPPAKQYRNAFEGVKESVFAYIASGTHAAREPVPSSTFNLATHDALNQVFATNGMRSLGQTFSTITEQDERGTRRSSCSGPENEEFGLDNLGFDILGAEANAYSVEGEDLQSQGFGFSPEMTFDHAEGYGDWHAFDPSTLNG